VVVDAATECGNESRECGGKTLTNLKKMNFKHSKTEKWKLQNSEITEKTLYRWWWLPPPRLVRLAC
jgi:hypothetical protein